MKTRFMALGAALLCSACSTPMLTSVDLADDRGEGTLTTYAVGVTEVEIRLQPYGGAAALPEACAAALTTYDAARLKYDEAVTPYGYAKDDAHEALRRVRTASPRGLTTLEKRTLLAGIKSVATLASAVRDAEAIATRAAQRVEERCPAEAARLEAVSHVRAAPDRLFGLRLQGGAMSNDDLRIQTGSDGLLTSISASADDRSGAAVVETASLIGRFLAPGSGGFSGAGAFLPPPPPPPPAPPPPPPSPEWWMVEREPSPPPPPPPPTAAERCRIAGLPVEVQLQQMERRLSCVDIPSLQNLLTRASQRVETFEDLRPPPPPLPARVSLTRLKDEWIEYGGLGIKAECFSPASVGVPARLGGVVVATPTPCELVVDDGVDEQRFAFTGLTSTHLSVIPVERADLVRNTTDLEFRAGVVSVVDVDRPSVGAAAFALPGQAISGVVRGITDALGNSKAIEEARVAQMTAETSRIQSEAARVVPPTPAWSAADTAYVSAMAEVENKRAEHARLVSAETPDTVQIAAAAGAIRNAQANANAAAQTAGRVLPFPDLI